MSKLVEKIIATGTIPAYAPAWSKLNDIQWIAKLDDIVKHPNKYRDSFLKRKLLEAVKKEICNNFIAASISANQLPDYVIRFGDWYEEYPDGRCQYVGPTGRKKLHKDLRADNDGDSLEEILRRKSKL